ncbi:MAG: alpha/beta hydrolase [Proteobacteria bacterium]|nr:alpha/beta hydrolase [Pseudomonadota bacterium]
MVIKRFILTLLAVVSLSGCSLASRHAKAVEIADPASMVERIIPAGMFELTVWERISKRNAPVDIYIEGDGLAWLDAHTKSRNPTPPDPLALRLAAADKADNVVYIARPCQYTGWNRSDAACSDLYWTNGRTAPEVMQAFQAALENIKARYNTTGINLVGYSGGAAVAVLVAADRTDVLSLRTVAGNLDYTTFSTFHTVSPMDASINPITVAGKLSHIPQRHFIGSEDKIVPPIILDSWKHNSGTTPCVQSMTVVSATHDKGWVEKWPELLGMAPSCGGSGT